MTAILGLLGALEAAILESPKIPLTDKTIIEETKILEIIDKIRLVLKNGSEQAQGSISQHDLPAKVSAGVEPSPEVKLNSDEFIKTAQAAARDVKYQADKYADEVLANLAATATRILRSVENGRSRLNRLNEKDAAGPDGPELPGDRARHV